MSTLYLYFKTKILSHPIRFLIALPFKFLEWGLGLPFFYMIVLQKWELSILLVLLIFICNIIGDKIFPCEWYIQCKKKNRC